MNFFVESEALAARFSGLAGHRAIGGMRASICNGLTLTTVEKLAGFMQDFQRQQTMTFSHGH